MPVASVNYRDFYCLFCRNLLEVWDFVDKFAVQFWNNYNFKENEKRNSSRKLPPCSFQGYVK